MIHIDDKKECCGCSACAQKCPRECITMRSDGEGFLYPQIDSKRCAECHLCEQVCPVMKKNSESTPLSVYAASNRNDTIRLHSSSGGVFSALAEIILEEGGLVFGAAFDSDLVVKHVCVESKSVLDCLRGSKYVQSNLGTCFKEIEKALKSGRKVLFSGVPCQVKALKLYLIKEYDDLFLVDTVCHGVPGPKTYDLYKKYCTTKIGGKLKSVDFRFKKENWESYHVKIESLDGRSMDEPFFENPYMKLFLKDISTRPSCSSCKAKSGRSYSDITLGDLWGIDNIYPELNDHKGLSAMLVNTDKGQSLLARVSGLSLHQVGYSDIMLHNPSIVSSAKPHINRGFFFAIQKLTRNFDMAYHAVTSQRLPFKALRHIYRCIER